MGKSLVIKGADFSDNGILSLVTWVGGYPSSILQGESGKVVSKDSIMAPLSSEITRLGMVGKTIKYIKLNAAAAGTLTIYKKTSDSLSDAQAFSVAAGSNIIELTTPISISSNSISIGVKGNGVLTYWSASENYESRGWLFSVNSVARIPVDFGY